MSFSDIKKQLSELEQSVEDAGGKVVGTVTSDATGFWGKVAPIVLGGIRGTLSPVTATLSGLRFTGSFLAYTTLGRAIVVLGLLLVSFNYFKSHFTKIERTAWEATVAKKQGEIIAKVESVDAKTIEAQRVARAKSSGMDSILGLVIGGIWKVEHPDPVESETVDLINETRGKR